MERCIECSSYAINPRHDGRDGVSDLNLCNVCYWRKRANQRLALLTEMMDSINFSVQHAMSTIDKKDIDKIIKKYEKRGAI